MVDPGKVTDQLPKVDPVLRREIEGDPAPALLILDLDRPHGQFVLGNLLREHLVRRGLFLPADQECVFILIRGLPNRPSSDPFRPLPPPDHLPDLSPSIDLNHYKVASFDRFLSTVLKNGPLGLPVYHFVESRHNPVRSLME